MEDVFILGFILGCSAILFGFVYKLAKLKQSKDVGIEEGAFNRLVEAFMQHKKDMEQRMKNVEAIIANKNTTDNFPEIEAPKNNDKLINDLDQKKKVRL